MKFIHLSDLHIGKRVNEFSMLEDQKFILNQILDITKAADAVVIAGDVYDKPIPSSEAVELFDNFLTSLAAANIPVLIISGNHDSPERIDFGSRIMSGQGIHIAGIFSGALEKVSVCNVDFYLLPFVKPANVKRFYPDENIDTYEDAIRVIIENTPIDGKRKNVLVAHQFVTASHCDTIRCDSESISVGGVDNIDFSVFDKFDYVALGHIHSAQSIGRDTVRYAGTPLKYSFSEARHNKSVTSVTIDEDISIELLPLTPLRDMREIKGEINTLLSPEIYSQGSTDDYMHITLTDEDEILDAIGKVRAVYPNVMVLDFQNSRTNISNTIEVAENAEKKSSLQLFDEFYEMQNNVKMNDEELKIISEIFEALEGDNR
jgi:exonuclease SbcD